MLFNGQSKGEPKYCRFRPGIESMITARARLWDTSFADTVERLCFIAEMSLLALDQSIVHRGHNGQGDLRNETEAFLNRIYGEGRRL